MKILGFVAENVRGIKIVELAPKGESVEISGGNGAGKSSVLDAIEKTLCGGDLPLKRGAEKGRVEIDLGELMVSRVITAKSDRLVVKNKDGASYPKPLEFLSKLVGDRAVSPLSFIGKKSRDQVAFLFQLCPDLQEGLAALSKRQEEIKAARSAALEIAQRARLFLADNPPIFALGEGYTDEINILALTAKKEEISHALRMEYEKNHSINERLRDAYETECAKARFTDELFNEEQHRYTHIIGKVSILLKDLQGFGYSGGEVQAWIDTLPTVQPNRTTIVPKPALIDEIPSEGPIRAIDREIAAAEPYNKKVRQNKARTESVKILADAENRFGFGLQELRRVDEDKAKLFASVKLPITGLSIEEGEITYNGVPIEQLSTAEKIKVGAAVSKAQNQAAEIILIDDASLLDSKSMAVLHECCAGMQLWTVLNDETGERGIYLEAGEVADAKTE